MSEPTIEEVKAELLEFAQEATRLAERSASMAKTLENLMADNAKTIQKSAEVAKKLLKLKAILPKIKSNRLRNMIARTLAD